MKIALVANTFYPAIGGYETVARILAKGFALHGNEVEVITDSPGELTAMDGFQVQRCVGLPRLVERLLWADVVVQNGLSLATVLPALGLRRPLFVIHHGWYSQHSSGLYNWKGQAKFLVSRLCRNISVSRVVAERLGAPSHVIGNPYDADSFKRTTVKKGRSGALFVGRLVSDKGCDTLLEALAIASKQGHAIELKIVGTGPEESAIRGQIAALRLTHQVKMLGAHEPSAVADLMNRSRTVVIPSRWEEPFGVVALEALACGCEVVASRSGGLEEATGGCAHFVEKNDPAALASKLIQVQMGLPSPATEADLACHLARHKPASVVAAYLDHIRSELRMKP